MALGSTNLSLRDIFYEIHKRYPNTGETVNLEALINASNLSDNTRPHNIGQFANYIHATKSVVQVDLYSSYDDIYADYVSASWRFYFDKPFAISTNIYFSETYNSIGDTYPGYITAAAGSSQVIYNSSYMKEYGSYDASISVTANNNYNIGVNSSASVYVSEYRGSSSSLLMQQ